MFSLATIEGSNLNGPVLGCRVQDSGVRYKAVVLHVEPDSGCQVGHLMASGLEKSPLTCMTPHSEKGPR